MGIEPAAYSSLEAAGTRSWERADGLGEGDLHGSCCAGTGQGGSESGRTGWSFCWHGCLWESRLWRVARSPQRGCISLGIWGGSHTAPLPDPQPGRACRWKACGLGWLLPLQAVRHHPHLPEPPVKFWDVLEGSWYWKPSSFTGFPGSRP